MKDKYTLQRDEFGEWISAPHNGGDLGNLSDITEELNRLYVQCKEFKTIIESYEKKVNTMTNAIQHSLLFPNNPATPLMRESLRDHLSPKFVEKFDQISKRTSNTYQETVDYFKPAE